MSHGHRHIFHHVAAAGMARSLDVCTVGPNFKSPRINAPRDCWPAPSGKGARITIQMSSASLEHLSPKQSIQLFGNAVAPIVCLATAVAGPPPRHNR
jgi:hypothetical protein